LLPPLCLSSLHHHDRIAMRCVGGVGSGKEGRKRGM